MIRIGKWDGAVLIGIGISMIALTLTVFFHNRRTLEGATRDVAGLEAQLDSVRKLQRVAAPADTARLRREVTDREFLVGRRAFHVPVAAESDRLFWRATGGGVLGVGLGTLFIAAGVAASIRVRRRPG